MLQGILFTVPWAVLLQADAGLTQLEALNLSGIQLSADVAGHMARFTGLHELTAGERVMLVSALKFACFLS